MLLSNIVFSGTPATQKVRNKAMGPRHKGRAMLSVALSTLAAYHRGGFLSSISSIETTKQQMTVEVTGILTNKTKLHSVNSTSNRTNKTLLANKTATNDLFLPENVGWPTRVPCGSQKCFYHLKTNRSIGYLVAPEMQSKRLRNLESGWQLAKQLERDYNIKHFLLESPRSHVISKEMAKHLNRNIYIEKYRVVRIGWKARRFKEGSTASIQKVKVAPKRHVIIGCVESKVYSFKKDFPKFLPYISDKESFAQNFNKSLATANAILDSEPCLTKDFQCLINTKGQFYHLDFDRCFSSSSRQKFEVSNATKHSCATTLWNMERHVQHALKLRE